MFLSLKDYVRAAIAGFYIAILMLGLTYFNMSAIHNGEFSFLSILGSALAVVMGYSALRKTEEINDDQLAKWCAIGAVVVGSIVIAVNVLGWCFWGAKLFNR